MDFDAGRHIETVLSHNLPPEYLIRHSPLKDDVRLDITYMAFHHMYTTDGFYVHDDNDDQAEFSQDLMLKSLIGQSLYCKQHLKYECRSAPLLLGNRTWMVAPYPRTHRLTSLDGVNRGKCMCATTEKKCLDPRRSCNCDSGESFWTDDSYELIGHEDVGITQIVMLKQDQKALDDSNIESQSRLTLSDLRCYGTKLQESQHEITFKTSDAYIEVPGWRKGDISFSFRTASNPPAIILYQLASSRNHGYLRLTLVSDTRLTFEFIVNRKPRKIFLPTSHKLNNGEWQQVFIEYDSANLRLTVNDDSALIDLDTNDYLGSFEGPLFVGGAPSKYLVGDLSKRNGFTGCFKGLIIADRAIDLRTYLSPSMPTVTSGCKPSCTKNLCQNGGKCIEYWGSYECECSNPIAHSGTNCEINLNTNSITFVTPESYYVQLSNDSHLYPSFLIKNILLNIRTYQETALILYASDHLNNFIQLHKNGSNLALTFNTNGTIITAQVPIEDEVTPRVNVVNLATSSLSQTLDTSMNPTLPPLVTNSTVQNNSTSVTRVNITNNSSQYFIEHSIRSSNTSGSGQPIQIKVERHRLRTTFYVNNNFMVIEKPISFLTNYTQNPWLNPEMELVRPPRPKIGSKTYSQIFLANIDEYFTTRLPGFAGCIQGLSIDNQLFDFNRAHLTGEIKGEYRIGCKMHCDSFPCKNQGTCIENWKEDRIECKCDATSYVGRLCDEDIAAIFNGQTSYFLYHLSKRFSSHPIKKVLISVPSVKQNTNSTNSTKSPYNETDIMMNDEAKAASKTNIDGLINFFELSLAFSTESGQQVENSATSLQVLVHITRANSSKHFFLGLTPDGSLLVQEDYGNSMSLSRLIKRPDHPFNDGHRHMFRYTRFNQTIKILADYQTYLPTLSVITSSQISRYSRNSVVMVGSAPEKMKDESPINMIQSGGNYTNYIGCISNLVIKFDDLTIEPLGEAFGQDIETINSKNTYERPEQKSPTASEKKSAALLLNEPISNELQQSDVEAMHKTKTSSEGNDKETKETPNDFETIIVRDVEQGKCASFKKSETINEKRSINEPKYTPVLEPRPIYMDPPRIKSYIRPESDKPGARNLAIFNTLFYCSVIVLVVVGTSTTVYAYILQVRYKSEKFRCETPFFHKRDDNGNEVAN